MQRYKILSEIEMRMEEVFGDDSIFETFLEIEQLYPNEYLLRILNCDESSLKWFVKTYMG